MKIINLLVLFVVISLTACASSGNRKLQAETQESVSQKLIEGKSTKTDVVRVLVDANTITFTDSGNEVWTYNFTRSKSKAINFVPYVNILCSGSNTQTKRVVVLFDREDVVTRYTMTDAEGETYSGVCG